jgi:hypothetical protein
VFSPLFAPRVLTRQQSLVRVGGGGLKADCLTILARLGGGTITVVEPIDDLSPAESRRWLDPELMSPLK